VVVEEGDATINGVPNPTEVPPQLPEYHCNKFPEPPVDVRVIRGTEPAQKPEGLLVADKGGCGI
jgi:hypothetical protein